MRLSSSPWLFQRSAGSIRLFGLSLTTYFLLPACLSLALVSNAAYSQQPAATAETQRFSAPIAFAAQSDAMRASSLPDLDAISSSSSALPELNGAEDGAQAPPKDAATQKAAQKEAPQDQQTKRILGVIPNFRAISSNEKLPPQSVKEKFSTATEDSFDYSSIFIPLALAGYSQATNATPEFGSGGVAFGRYLWHAAVDQTSENYMVEFIVPSLTHEDTRYYTLGHGGFWKRTGYALSRAVITRSDAGNDTFNLSEVVGAGASAGISTLYYPSRERSFGNVGRQWGQDIGIDALSFEAKEFWPNINRWLFHKSTPGVQAAQ
jgi:hypothetical protein